MKKTTEVFLADTKSSLSKAVRQSFDYFGGAAALLKSSKNVFIKVNAVDLRQHAYTNIDIIRESIIYFKENGANNVYIIENCTQGNFTRLVFKVTGITSVCEETGAIPVYLDETKSIPIFLESLECFIDISDFIFENLIMNRNENLYVSLPKLKTHSMSQVTLSIKNQFGFVHQKSRIADHNYRIHQKFTDIYRILRPDFVLVDCMIATNHGHYIAVANTDKCIVPMNLLISGKDPLAVDVVGADLIGYTIDDVEHLRRCKELEIGIGDIRHIEIINSKLFNKRKKKLTHELLEDFPPQLSIIRGKERCCPEGCKSNTETLVEVLFRDYDGEGDFTILMGKGIDPKEVELLKGRVHIAGSCAIQDHGLMLLKKLGKKNVTMSHGCNNLAESIYGLCKHMKVNPLKLVPINPIFSLSLLAQAKINGSKAMIPRLI